MLSTVDRIDDDGIGDGVGVRIGDRKIIAVIPAYNEERFIGSVVLKAQKYAYQVVVVDDGSTDATAEIAAAAGAVVVKHEHNLGKGMALNTGFNKARELSPEAVVTIDADGQHVPEETINVVMPVLENQADIVVGSRYMEQTSDVPRHRILGHIFFNFMSTHASGVPLTDSQSGFRAFSRRALNAIAFNSSGFSVESEMQFLARDHNLKMMEVPITILYTDKPKRPVLAHGLMVLNGILRLVGQYRPLLFFGMPGFFLILAGLGWGTWVIDIYRSSHILPLGYSLISVLLIILGNLVLFTGIILHSVRGLLLDMVRSKNPGASMEQTST